ncbi:M23 family metallopeptidase [Aureimonas jatrophae]|uniref:Peptidase family M23 n=1 Tax=Aureimonas jatrophae TaxID=1166073 RepID=A0A1H0HPB0_9HYPH|nr:M23 family metallopeptidase [Aureimonas jatrophae]MBB3950700.1 murein DD-endopeptidase MepM/ murein hydrolase activator NlpD [Aureimonas jatrophae]SDO21026.1 Peptidase family M23 [Aureimonas jatrophae]
MRLAGARSGLMRLAFGAVLAGGPAWAEDAPPLMLGLPVACALGADCFVQQFPDMDAGPGATDPFCGTAAYDGHDGLDIRLLSMRDVARGVAVVAPAAGTVRGVRDGMEDRFASTPELRAAIRGTECGNGVVIDHGAGVETQVCHLRKGSVAVRAGERVETGAKLGEIGASGLAEFPHVHLSVRQEGRKVDPVSGRPVGSGCRGDEAMAASWFSPDARKALLAHPPTAILATGLSGAPVDYNRLVVDGPPPVPASGEPATLAYGWYANVRGGDRIRLTLTAPDGSRFMTQDSEPLAGAKAAYSAFAGRRQALRPGLWHVRTDVLRDGATVASREERVEVAP